MLNAIYDKIMRNTRQSSERVLSIAQRAVKRPELATDEEVKSMAASIISQARR